MDYVILDTLSLLLCLKLGYTYVTYPDTPEYCQWETYNTTCAKDEVILMTAARYGRMELGRCVSKDYGHIGCSVDVLFHIDAVCSGRRSCSFVVPDATLRDMKPCPKDFALYFQAKHNCAKVETGAGSLCYTSKQVNVTGTSGYLSSLITAESGFGSEACPWVIRVDSGQRINITLLDFTLATAKTNGYNEINKIHKTYCKKYATIKETEATRETVVCGGEEREKVVFISAGSTVEITMQSFTSLKRKDIAHFLLKYEAIGCPVLLPPRDGWIEQVGQDVLVGCNTTREKWYLRCNGKNWIGNMRNCSALGMLGDGGPGSEQGDSMWNVVGDDWSSPVGILIVTALGVALGLIVGVIMLAAVLFCLKRRRTLCHMTSTHAHYPPTGDSDEEREEFNANSNAYYKHNAGPMATDNMELMNLNADGNYGAMWKSRPPNYATDNHHTSSPAPPQTDVTSSEHQPRTVLEQTETLTPLHRPNCDVFNTKISTLVSFRTGQPPIRNAHVYKSPTFIPRSDIPDIQEIAMHAH